MIKIAPSLLAADYLNLGAEAERALSFGADRLHLDIMDARFAPNLSFGPALVRALRARFPVAFLDTHLMLCEPGRYLNDYLDSTSITVHVEIEEDIALLLDRIHEKGIKTGLSLRPRTDVSALYPYLSRADEILIMSVEPGFGGQKFMPETLRKAVALRERGYTGGIAIDGGINAQNARLAANAGVDCLIMGTALMRADNPKDVADACRG